MNAMCLAEIAGMDNSRVSFGSTANAERREKQEGEQRGELRGHRNLRVRDEEK